ncbi:MAG: Helix-turn-helix domain [Halanaerobiales bacterium]|nr:Helix-turn-helix domain [Halanaerobiales bacterium]
MLTTKEAAEILDVNPQTIRDYIHRGAIEAEKKGPHYYVNKKELEKVIPRKIDIIPNMMRGDD